MKFSEKIVRLRKIKGITQDEFANAVGVSRQAVYKWECGQSYPEAIKLVEIKALFGISIDDLLDDNYEVALPEKKKRKRISKAKTERIVKAAENEILENAAEEEINEVAEAEVTVVETVAEPVIEITESVNEEIQETVAVEDVSLTEITETVAEKEHNEEPVDAAVPFVVENVVKTEEVNEDVKKRGFFSRIFGRK